MDKNMEKEFIITRMEINILEIGREIKRMGREYLNLLMELCMMVNGKMIKLVKRDN